MNTVLFDETLNLPEEAEARREHERYQCNNIVIHYSQLISGSAVSDQLSSSARIKDISLKGLAIESDNLFQAGDILSLEIDHDSAPAEKLTAIIMWCKPANDPNNYRAGLRVVNKAHVKSESTETEILPQHSNQNQLVCPSCAETSFFLREINSTNDQADIHHCCRCNHSHPITDVIAFNRHLS